MVTTFHPLRLDHSAIRLMREIPNTAYTPNFALLLGPSQNGMVQGPATIVGRGDQYPVRGEQEGWQTTDDQCFFPISFCAVFRTI